MMEKENPNTKKEIPKDLSEMYSDETHDLVRSMKESADRMTEAYHENPYDARDIITDIVFFFVVTVTAFVWLMLMLLIVSFVGHSYIHMKIDKMILVSVLFAIGAAVFYIVIKVKKYAKYMQKMSPSRNGRSRQGDDRKI